MLDFEKFSLNKLDKKIDKKLNIINSIMNESWASKNIMKMINIADKNSDRAWYHSFVKDFYTVFNISIDKIEDADFHQADDPMIFFKGEYKKERDRYLAIFYNDDKKLNPIAAEDHKKLMAKFVEFEFTEPEINALISSIAKGQTEFKKEFKKIGNKNVSEKDAQLLFEMVDGIRNVEIPFLVGIVMGGHSVFNNFRTMPERDKGEKLAKRYGIINAQWLTRRYWGLHTATDVTSFQLVNRSTKVWWVDVKELKTKYDMGSKLSDRKEAKKGNIYFMTKDEATLYLKDEFKRRLLVFKNNNLDPDSILKMFQATMNAYNKYYQDSLKHISDKNADAIIRGNIEINNNMMRLGDVSLIVKFDALIKDYMKVYTENAVFMKHLNDNFDEIKIKNMSKHELNAKEQQMQDQLTGYTEQIVEFKKKAEILFKQMTAGGVKFTGKEKKLFK